MAIRGLPTGTFGLEHGRVHCRAADSFEDGVGIDAELPRHQHRFAVRFAENAQERDQDEFRARTYADIAEMEGVFADDGKYFLQRV